MVQSVNNRGALSSDPVRNFRFIVKFLPLTVSGDNGWKPEPQIGFTSVSGLAINTESIPYREGGYNTSVHQIPGQTTFSPVTFQRGVTIGSTQHWDWMKMLFQTITGTSYNNNQAFRSDVEIAVLHHPVPYSTVKTTGYGTGASEGNDGAALDDKVMARFRLYNAWPTSIAYSDLNAGDNALMVEQMTLVHEGLDMKWATDAPGATADAF